MSWDGLVSWGRAGGVLGVSWERLGVSWGCLEGMRRLGSILERRGASWGRLGGVLGRLGGALDVSWGRLGCVLGCLEACSACPRGVSEPPWPPKPTQATQSDAKWLFTLFLRCAD